MSTKYKPSKTEGAYFITITTVGWIDVFTRLNLHNNPVKEKIVAFPEDYYFSSARNYAGLDND